MARQGVPERRMSVVRRVHVRYAGTDRRWSWRSAAAADDRRRLRGARIASASASSCPTGRWSSRRSRSRRSARPRAPSDPVLPLAGAEPPAPVGRARVRLAGAEHETPIYDRDVLRPGNRVAGPAIIAEATGTTVVEPGWRAEVTERGHLVLTRVVALKRTAAVGTAVDPVMLECSTTSSCRSPSRWARSLENTGYSVNIKERLDFSCALFDRTGELIANAPHMPVHLGSMGESVHAIIRERGTAMSPGDVFVLNAPYDGGTHLPDITVVTPVFDAAGETILFYVASRGHHADIGGITPGSMPPDSKTVDEEGVLIDNFLLVERGRFREAELLALLASGPLSRAQSRARTSPTSRRRSPPARRACRNCAAWWRISAWRWCTPIWATCRTTPRSRCAA